MADQTSAQTHPFDEAFAQLAKHRVAVCRSYRNAVLPGTIARHVNRQHVDLQLHIRQQIVERALELERSGVLAPDVDGIEFPGSEAAAVPGLAVWGDGKKCVWTQADGQQCGHIQRTRCGIQAHCRDVHGWVNGRGRGGRPGAGAAGGKDGAWVDGVHCQRFGQAGALQRLFEVAAPTARQGTGQAQPARQVLRQFEALAKAIQDGDRKAEAVVGEQSRFSANTWIRRTGWARHLRGFDREWLAATTQKPDAEGGRGDQEGEGGGDGDGDERGGAAGEEALARVLLAAERVIWRAQRASRVEVVGSAAMNFVDRREAGGEANERPFNAGQKGQTMERYSESWKSIVAYVWRTWDLEAVGQGAGDVVGQGSADEGDGAGDSEDGNRPGETGQAEGIRDRRPPYELTENQASIWEQLREAAYAKADREPDRGPDNDRDGTHSDHDPPALEGYVSEFFVALLDHDIGDTEFQNALYSGLAVLGIQAGYGWRSALIYTPRLSAIVTVARMLVLYKAAQDRRSHIRQRRQARGESEEEAGRKTQGHFERVQRMVRKFMTLVAFDGRPSPMDSILRLRAYGRAIRANTNADGVVDWHGDELLYGQVQFSMASLRTMVHGLLHTAKVQLWQEILLLETDGEVDGGADARAGLPPIKWHRLVDNAAETRAGWSFVDDARRLFVDDGAVVFVTMYNKTMGMSAKAKVIHRYLPREVGELAVYYVWLAIPFWRMVVKSGSRGAADWGSAYMWEPREEAAWAFPEAAGMQGGKRSRPAGGLQVRDRNKRRRGQLGGEGQLPMSSDQGQSSLEPDGQSVGSARYGRSPPSRRGIDSHGAARSDVWEAERWDTNRITRAVARVSVTHMGERLTIMAWRHAVKAVYRRYIKDKSIVEIMEDADTVDGGGEDVGGATDALHGQSGHGASIGEAIYGRSIDESLYSTEARRLGFRRVSREWHAFLMFDSVLREEGGRRTSRSKDVARQATAEEDRRWRAARQVDVQAQLEQMLGAGTTFRGVQEAALRAIMRQESPVVVVMGTGGGKSMLFMLPARCSGGGLTVVVVPLVSLRSDIKDRCDELGIECVEWNSGRPHEWASVVLVTPESAVGESFGHFINRQRAMGRLDRIVVDECHVVLDSGSGGSWRTRVLGLKGLVRAETQSVYLTATLRPADEEEFGRLVGLPGEGVRWFRGATTRKNVGYRIRRYSTPDETEEDALAGLVEEKKEQFGREGQIIVYCDTVKKAVKYAKRLGGLCYHRGVGSQEEKKAIVRQLTGGQHQVFTATNALGLGVDAATIRAVIHVGLVRRLRDYAQESGRAGRDGGRSEAIILKAVKHDRRGRAVEETAEQAEERGVEREMWEFTETKRCVRAVLDREMDGRTDREGCGDGEEGCYRCVAAEERRRQERLAEAWNERGEEAGRGGAGGEAGGEAGDGRDLEDEEEVDIEVEAYQARVQRRRRGWDERIRQSAEALEVVQFGEILERWASGCTWCRATGQEEAVCAGHGLEECLEQDAAVVREAVQKWEREIRWEQYSCCFDCGVPQAMCRRYEGRSDGGYVRREGRCQYGGVLTRTVMSIWGANSEKAAVFFRERLRQRGVEWVDGDGDEELIKLMCRKVRWGGLESNEMCRAAVGLYEVYKGQRE